MSPRRRIALSLLLLAGFGTSLWYALQPREPVYEGKRLTLWLRDLSVSNLQSGSDAERALRSAQAEKARNAVKQIGTNAVPQLLRMLRTCRPESKMRRFTQNLLDKQRLIQVELPAHEDLSWLAPFGFEALGSASVGAIPDLCRMLANPYTSMQSANCLRHIGPAAAPALVEVAAKSERAAAIPALLLLGDFGQASQSAVPLLEQLANNPGNPVAGPALRVLSRLHERPNSLLPLLIDRLNQTNFASDAAFALAGAGWDGVPPLMDAVTNGDPQIRAAGLCGLALSFRGTIQGRRMGRSNFSNENMLFDERVAVVKGQTQTRFAWIHLPLVLNRALECTNAGIRLKAVELVAGSGLFALAALSRAADDPDPQVSGAAQKAIAALGVEVRNGAVIRGSKERRRLALVFTGHEHAEGAETILRELERHKAKGSFFLTGDFLRNPAFASVLERLRRSGHQVGPHSDKHLLYCSWDPERKTLVSREEFQTDFDKNNTALQQSGFDYQPYLVPPYEHYNQQIADWAQYSRLVLVSFSPGTRSTADYTQEGETNFVSSQAIFTSIVTKEEQDPNGLNGFILLLHLGAGPDRADKFHTRVGALLDRLAAKGYEFVTVDELLRPGAPD